MGTEVISLKATSLVTDLTRWLYDCWEEEGLLFKHKAFGFEDSNFGVSVLAPLLMRLFASA